MAVGPRVAVGTVAFVLVDEILAGAAVHAGSGGAILVVDLTVGPRKAFRALAGVRVDKVGAGGAVLTRGTQTLVNVLFATSPGESARRRQELLEYQRRLTYRSDFTNFSSARKMNDKKKIDNFNKRFYPELLSIGIEKVIFVYL